MTFPQNKNISAVLSFVAVLLFFAPLTSAQTNNAITLLWQTGATTHPFYSGKTLLAKGGDYSIVALVDTTLSPNSLVYTWQKDTTVLGSKSGIGRQTLTLSGELIGANPRIGVTVETQSGTLIGSETITIPFTAPRIVLYERDPLLGVLFERALQNTFALHRDETTLSVFPFYFSIDPTVSRNTTVRWSFNDERIDGVDELGLTIRAPEEGEGASRVSVEALHTSKLLQEAAQTLSVVF